MINARILVVEDEEDIQEMLSINLIREGYQVTTCGTIAAGKIHLNEQKFDLLITDNYLTDGLGSELIKHLAGFRNNFQIQTVLMTAAAELDDKDKDLVADVLLFKPFSMQDFRNLIRNLLSTRLPSRLLPPRKCMQFGLIQAKA